MKVTYINNTDLIGSRFNGYNLQKYLNSIKIKSKLLVYDKMSSDPNVISFADSVDTMGIYSSYESTHSWRQLLIPYSRKIANMPDFLNADIIHYHLFHNNLISIPDFPHMTKLKPSIWTMHDPWCFTGHCIYPLDCQKWRTGCGECPDLQRSFSMREDRTAEFWQLKKSAWAEVDADIVISTKWMENFIKASPLTSHFKRVHIIPFGIDLDLFKPNPEKRAQVRKALKIPKDNVVIMFRSDPNVYKNSKFIECMLNKLDQKLSIIAVGMQGLLKLNHKQYHLHDLGWLSDDEKLSGLYAASDIFLMPSLAESFGLMAIEAMASELPVIVLKDTVLESITFADDAGIAIQNGDLEQFVSVVRRLCIDSEERKKRGVLSRKLAEEHYDEKQYLENMVSLYKEIKKRKR